MRGLLAACVVGGIVTAIACGSAHDAGEADAGVVGPATGGTGGPASPTGTGGTASPTGTPPFGTGGTTAGFPGPAAGGASGGAAPDTAGMCFLRVAIECDGDEDCSSGKVCCGDFDSAAFTYTAITCRASCDGMASYKLCHPGETCAAGQECRHSQVIPHDFISVCAGPANVSSAMTGKNIANAIVCGSAKCTGDQKCCLPGVVDSGTGTQANRVALTPYCVDSASECDCGGDAADAGADDAG